ncbi:MAG: hypothetical protein LC754_05455 [Acidobacteria bacterium]|nr:hypothetical protein [Acidobacteriota bacterium]
MQTLVFCTERECGCDDSVEEGVFLRHVNCKMRNPFWDESAGEVIVPGNPDTSRAAFPLEFGSGKAQQVWVQHWQLGALRTVPKNEPEMWFPLMLLRATAEKNGKGRMGRLVELAGARESGKTVLAVQAMNHHGYVPAKNTTDSVELDNYIFSRNSGNLSFSVFLETLHLNTLLRRNAKEIFLPRATINEPGHLKATFIRPAPNSRATLAAGQEKSDGRLRAAGSWLYSLLRQLTGEIRVAAGQVIRSGRPFWYTLVLYDTAGEASENEDLMPDLAAVDRVAVVVNAAEIFGVGPGKSEKSIEVAVQRIAKAKKRGQPCDLILTQMDRLKPAEKHTPGQTENILDLDAAAKDEARVCLSDEDWRKVVEIANDLNDDRRKESQALLTKWLDARPDENKVLLRKSLKNVKQIFFVWTENLPPQHEPAEQLAQPCSYGLAKFVCRCLDIKWENINQRSDD